MLILLGIFLSTEFFRHSNGLSCESINFGHSRSHILSSEAFFCQNFSEFNHAQYVNVEWHDFVLLKPWRLDRCFPIFNGGLNDNLAQMTPLVTTFSDGHHNNGR